MLARSRHERGNPEHEIREAVKGRMQLPCNDDSNIHECMFWRNLAKGKGKNYLKMNKTFEKFLDRAQSIAI
ncbi:hypothetical protein [Halomonas sp. M20]|uniref:hypothetical protein n=1 Tax=Halomonas sp. M20 TaxID=2763264 RepID=UPI001D0BBF15|nr:hypothetical protein [Halomonas sp. M20]